MTQFSWSVEERERASVRIKVMGDVTEDSDFTALRAECDRDEVILDLAEIHRINSTGVRGWLFFVSTLGVDNRLVFDRMPNVFVHQNSMVHGFTGQARVRTALAPFFCADCDEDQECEIDLERDIPAQLTVTQKCRSCGGEATFDGVMTHYQRLCESGG